MIHFLYFVSFLPLLGSNFCVKWPGMEANVSAQFKIWGVDDVVYGPVELPTLISWVKEERVTADTWIFHAENDRWHKAAAVPELQLFFPRRASSPASSPAAETPLTQVKTGMLRRVKILADLNEDQLERFVSFMEVNPVRQWSEIVKQGQSGDAMFLVLEGELRVRLMINGKETILATLLAGECFGEIALYDQGPRSADVVANSDSLLVKISAASFEHLAGEAPDLATPFLRAVGKTLTARIRADNKRFGDSVKFARAAY